MKGSLGIFWKFTAVFVLFLGILVLPNLQRNAMASGTDAGFILTNSVTLSWTGGSLSAEVYNEVGTNYGGSWYGTNTALADVNAGSFAENRGYFTNEGNAPADFQFYYTIESTSAAQAWNAYLTNQEGSGVGGSNISVNGISQGGIKTISLIVNIPANETNGASNIYRCVASNEQARGAGAVRYTGSNSVVYGGTMGIDGAGPGVLYLNAGNQSNWTVLCKAATMQLVRTYSFTNPAPYTAVANPVPGALIFLKLAYTNAGGSTASSLTIVDTFNTNKLQFFPDSLKKGLYVDDYASAGASLTTNINNDEGAWLGDNKVYFTPPGGLATNTTGSVASGDSGAFFYRLTLN